MRWAGMPAPSHSLPPAPCRQGRHFPLSLQRLSPQVLLLLLLLLLSLVMAMTGRCVNASGAEANAQTFPWLMMPGMHGYLGGKDASGLQAEWQALKARELQLQREMLEREQLRLEMGMEGTSGYGGFPSSSNGMQNRNVNGLTAGAGSQTQQQLEASLEGVLSRLQAIQQQQQVAEAFDARAASEAEDSNVELHEVAGEEDEDQAGEDVEEEDNEDEEEEDEEEMDDTAEGMEGVDEDLTLPLHKNIVMTLPSSEESEGAPAALSTISSGSQTSSVVSNVNKAAENVTPPKDTEDIANRKKALATSIELNSNNRLTELSNVHSNYAVQREALDKQLMHDMEVIRKHMQDPSRRRSAQAEKSKVLEAFASKALALRVSLEQKVAELNSSYQKRAEDLKTHFVEDRIQILQRRRQEELQRLRKSIEDEHAQKLKETQLEVDRLQQESHSKPEDQVLKTLLEEAVRKLDIVKKDSMVVENLAIDKLNASYNRQIAQLRSLKSDFELSAGGALPSGGTPAPSSQPASVAPIRGATSTAAAAASPSPPTAPSPATPPPATQPLIPIPTGGLWMEEEDDLDFMGTP